MSDPKQLEQQALAAFQRRDRDAAGEHLRALAALDGRAGASWGPLSRMAMVCGETDAAVALFRREAEPKPSNAPLQAEYAGLLAQANRMDEALEVSRRLIEMLPENATALHLHGTLLSQIGDRDGAEDYLGRAVDEAELSGPSWLALSALKRFNKDDPDYKKLESLAARIGNTPEENRPSFHYALGKARIDLDKDERGFEAFGAGAEMVRGQRKHDADANRKFAERMMDESRAERALTPSGLDTGRPIFVSGLPRCGSTLVEQILSSHSEVAGGGELNLFRAALMPVGQPFPSTAELYEQRVGESAWRDIGETYLRMISERFGDTGRVVDKTLNHSRHMPILRHIFPNAKIVWVRRNPADTALSCYRTYFTRGVNWSWDWTDIARYFQIEDRLYKHWAERYPDAILTVKYEDLVSDPDSVIPQILSHCGLADEPATRQAHQSDRPVYTASTLQIREPIHQRSIEGWRRFGDQMKPFLDLYGRPA